MAARQPVFNVSLFQGVVNISMNLSCARLLRKILSEVEFSDEETPLIALYHQLDPGKLFPENKEGGKDRFSKRTRTRKPNLNPNLHDEQGWNQNEEEWEQQEEQGN